MASFAYQVRDREGRKVKGVIEAASERAAADRLSDEGFLISVIKPTALSNLFRNLSFLAPHISADDLTMFYFQLGNMADAGIPVLAALRATADQITSPTFKKIVSNLVGRVDGGASLSEAMSHSPKIFPLLYRSMVHVGETSGHLAETLRHIAELNESSSELRYQIRSALAYPMVLMVACMVVVTLMVLWFVPTFAAVFDRAGIPLPLPTRMIYGLSLWIKSNWLSVLGSLLAFVVFIGVLLRIPSLRYRLDKFWVGFPVLGLLITRVEVARWTRSVALMLSSGVPLLQTLKISQELVQNLAFQKSVKDAFIGIQEGKKLADTLQKGGAFPSDVIQMVSTGENSGTLGEMLYKVAHFYEQLIARALKRLTGAIEPAFILLMGCIVGFIMLSILLPIFDMLKLFQSR